LKDIAHSADVRPFMGHNFVGRSRTMSRVSRCWSRCLGIVLLVQSLGCAGDVTEHRVSGHAQGDGAQDKGKAQIANEAAPRRTELSPRSSLAQVRFVVLGDGGTGSPEQFAVADRIAAVCAQRGCEFALYTGDNIYQRGVNGVDDAQFESKFEEPYSVLDFPFYMALGNHDYRGVKLEQDPDPTQAEVDYTTRSRKWAMPHQYYTERVGPVQIFAIDTNAIRLGAFRTRTEQSAWLETELARSDAPWKIVFGHHPYLSNGMHGSADDANLPTFIEESVCGRAQVYFAGHDHDREWLEPSCGTTFIVSGAAAQVRRVRKRGVPTRFKDGSKLGFLWVEIVGNVMHAVFYDVNGKIDYEDTLTL
jgi:hypothetical protein